MPRRFTSALASDLTEGEILTYASAMAFRTLFAAIPLALAFIALLGFLDLTSLWTAELGPSIQPTLGPAFPLLDGTVQRILVQRQGFWLTLGLPLAIWQLSIAVSIGVALCLVVAAMGALERVAFAGPSSEPGVLGEAHDGLGEDEL